jgi:hypothetical protein
MLSWVKLNLNDTAFSAISNDSDDPTEQQILYDSQYRQDLSTKTDLSSYTYLDFDNALYDKEDTSELSKTDIERYRLWHERYVHARPKVIRNLHYRTTLKKVKVPEDREACITCKLAKIYKRIGKELSPWKETILALIYADIAGLFYTSLQGNQYMAKLVDSASRMTWVILGKDRKDVVRNLQN